MHEGFQARDGDGADVAILSSEREQAIHKLRATGWEIEAVVEEGSPEAVTRGS